MASDKELMIAGGIVAAGIAWYLMSDADAAELPPVVKQPPAPLPPGPFQPGGFKSKLCPGIEPDMPDEYKREIEDMLASNLSAFEYSESAKNAAAAGYPAAAVCLEEAASRAAAKEHPDVFGPVKGGQKAVDQTKTCSYWIGVYNGAKQRLDAAIANAGSDPQASQKIQVANSDIAMARAAITQLGGCGIVLP